jgi:quercetin dioxygenase-like cupin family protein
MSSEFNALCRAAKGEVIETAWGRLVWTASGTVGNSKTMSLGRATIRAGMENPRHRHPNCDEILHVIAGRLEHIQDDARCILEPGDTVSIPKGVWHQARSLGSEDAQVVICFDSPNRLTEVDSSITGSML